MASGLAKRLRYIHIDTGAMYRAVTLFFLRQKVNIKDLGEVQDALQLIEINLTYQNETQATWLNHENIEHAIRRPEVSDFVSEVSTLSVVRAALVEQQRKLGLQKGIVMDGRDIGTTVFPDAELKLFLIADLEVRVNRRWLEWQSKGIKATPDEVRENLILRDKIDSSRIDSPLRQANDATVIDTSYLTPNEQLQIAFDLARTRIHNLSTTFGE